MPAKSKARQHAADLALAARRGKTPVSDFRGVARAIHDSTTEKELEDLAESPAGDLPDHVEDGP